jgi:hypothetical protein
MLSFKFLVKYTALNVTRQYPLVLLVEVLWGRVYKALLNQDHMQGLGIDGRIILKFVL